MPDFREANCAARPPTTIFQVDVFYRLRFGTARIAVKLDAGLARAVELDPTILQHDHALTGPLHRFKTVADEQYGAPLAPRTSLSR